MATDNLGRELSEKQNVRSRYWTFSISDSTQWERLCEYCETEPDFYAYIKHQPESSESSEHVHFYIEFKNDHYLSSLSKELNLPSNLIEKCRSKTAILKYFLHMTERAIKEGKTLYSVDDVFTNMDLSKIVSPHPKGMTDQEYWLITDTVDDYFKGNLSYRDMMKVLKPLFQDISPATYFRMCFNAKSFDSVKADDFEHIPFDLKKTDAGGLSSRVSGHASKQGELFKKGLGS